MLGWLRSLRGPRKSRRLVVRYYDDHGIMRVEWDSNLHLLFVYDEIGLLVGRHDLSWMNCVRTVG